LEEIQEKFRIIRKGERLLDVGAAPGSWTLYALKVLQGSGFVLAVDLNPLSVRNLPKNAAFLQGDITDSHVKQRLLEQGPYDLVMSDAAPNTTGNRTVDSGRSFSLVWEILDISAMTLRAGGSVVVKIFQGGDEGQVLERLHAEYENARALKPKASRKVSFETYCIGIGKRSGGGAENEGPSR
jgi:23S rRNA (uridine2552-2'-O)-methyltransferase